MELTPSIPRGPPEREPSSSRSGRRRAATSCPNSQRKTDPGRRDIRQTDRGPAGPGEPRQPSRTGGRGLAMFQVARIKLSQGCGQGLRLEWPVRETGRLLPGGRLGRGNDLQAHIAQRHPATAETARERPGDREAEIPVSVLKIWVAAGETSRMWSTCRTIRGGDPDVPVPCPGGLRTMKPRPRTVPARARSACPWEWITHDRRCRLNKVPGHLCSSTWSYWHAPTLQLCCRGHAQPRAESARGLLTLTRNY